MRKSAQSSSSERTCHDRSPPHLYPDVGRTSGFGDYAAPDVEAPLNGNSVSLEEEMMKVADTQAHYQAATNLYARAINMMRTAIDHADKEEPPMDLATSMIVAASGMRAQSTRMRTSRKTSPMRTRRRQTPGGDPYRRKIATMNSDFDHELNATLVKPGKPSSDMTDFHMQFDPGNPVGRQARLCEASQCQFARSKSWICARRSAPTKPTST